MIKEVDWLEIAQNKEEEIITALRQMYKDAAISPAGGATQHERRMRNDNHVE